MQLMKKFGRSTAWMSVAASGTSIVSFIVFIVLSRLLAPEEIGLVAFALIFVELGKIVVNAGFQQAIVRQPQWTQSYATTSFYASLMFAVFITSLVLLLLVPLAEAYYAPKVGPILQALSVIFVIEGLKTVHEGKLKREFQFKAIALRTIIGSLLSGIIGIYLAVEGYGVWALVWQQIINHIAMTAITVASANWKPTREFSKADLQDLLTFSSPVMFAQMIGSANMKSFEFLIGILIGPAALGFYRVGGRALFILQDIVLKPFESTVLSALSRMENRDQQAANAIRIMKTSAFVTVPIFFGASVIAPDFIVMAFGEKWAASGNIMRALAIGIAPLAVSYQINAALMASGESGKVLKISIAGFCLSVILGVCTIHFGLFTAACVFALRGYLITILNMHYFRKVFDINIGRTLMQIAPPFIASTLMWLLLLLIQDYMIADMANLMRLLVVSVIGVMLYLLINVLVFRQEVLSFLDDGVQLVPGAISGILIRLKRLLSPT